MSYFLLAVSSRENLEICLKYNMAGLPGSQNGLWTFLEINEGDYVSFLYGAKITNLYKVISKKAYREFSEPWKPIKFRSRKTYSFPYRLFLSPIRTFNESIVRPEFLYVAEDLLLRGGYRKTHFQADQMTLHFVSTLGELANDSNFEKFDCPEELEYTPKITFNKKSSWELTPFNELILQVLAKRKLSEELDKILQYFGFGGCKDEYEILSEKATEQGFLDLLIKPKYPLEKNNQIVIEIKKTNATKSAIQQLIDYLSKNENYKGGILVANQFDEKLKATVKEDKRILLMRYNLNVNVQQAYTFDELYNNLTVEISE